MTDLLFNELLDTESQEISKFYSNRTHYEPSEYVRIVADGPSGMAISAVEDITPADNDLVTLMRRLGAQYAIGNGTNLQPMAIFVVQAAHTMSLADPSKGAERALVIYGITNDGRYNMAILPAQWDEDDRLYAEATHIYHWGDNSGLQLDPLPYLEFFRVNEDTSEKLETASAQV